MVRDVSQNPNFAKTYYGAGGWKEASDDANTDPGEEFRRQVLLFPEQMINVEDVSSVDYTGVQWPCADDIMHGQYSTGEEALLWLEQQFGDDLVRRPEGSNNWFMFRQFDYDDGVQGTPSKMYIIVDCDEASNPPDLSIADILGEEAAREIYYKMVLYNDNDRLLLTEGGRFDTQGVEATSPIQLGEGCAAIVFEQPVRSPELVDENAVYAMPADEAISPRLAIHAKHWNGAPLEVRADAKALGWPREIYLHDDGQNGDMFAGDDVYTYVGNPLTVAEGDYTIPVVLTGTDGLMYFGEVTVNVTGPANIALTDGSSQTGDLNTMDADLDPYASAAFDYDGDSFIDLFITFDEDHPGDPTKQEYGHLMRRWNISAGGVPLFSDQTQNVFGDIGSAPAGQKGIAPEDFDNDGDIDLFVAHPETPILYIWNSGEGQYENGNSVFSDLLGQCYDGDWADFDGDGLLDLAISRADIPSEGPDTGQKTGSVPLLYRNTESAGNYTLQLVDPQVFTSSPHLSYEVVWCDVNGDSRPDVFFSDLWADTGCSLLIQQENGSFAESDWFGGNLPECVRSAIFMDYNDDGREDLVVACWSGTDNLRIYTNTGSSFAETEKASRCIPIEPNDLSGLATGDFDRNGQLDLVVTPYRGSQSPYLLLNAVNGPPGVFSRYEEMIMGQGRADGAVVADWGGDLDPDIYLARQRSVDGFFYQNETIDPTAQLDCLQVRLVGGMNNRQGIGAVVEINSAGASSPRTVDTKNGRCATPAIVTLTAGMLLRGQTTVPVHITWPNGYEQDVAECSLDTLNVIEEDSQEIIESSVVSQYRPGPGENMWIFTWHTKGPTLSNMDAVIVFDPSDPGDNCHCQGNIALTPSMATVDHYVSQGSGYYSHKIIWHDGCCYPATPACTYTFDVISGNTLKTASSCGHTFQTMTICAAQAPR